MMEIPDWNLWPPIVPDLFTPDLSFPSLSMCLNQNTLRRALCSCAYESEIAYWGTTFDLELTSQPLKKDVLYIMNINWMYHLCCQCHLTYGVSCVNTFSVASWDSKYPMNAHFRISLELEGHPDTFWQILYENYALSACILDPEVLLAWTLYLFITGATDIPCV